MSNINIKTFENIKEYIYGAKATAAHRKYLCEKFFPAFVIYYFTDFLHYAFADFHWDMYGDIDLLNRREKAFCIWMMFRESAKTTIAKIYACYLGAYGKKKYINFDSYEKENAENSLFDIRLWFQTNKKLIADFGQLYFEEHKEKSTMKRVGAFILKNGVKYEAFSTQESVRGRVYQDVRPDAFFLDDTEISKTVRSAVITRAIISHIDELMAGLSPTAILVMTCNYISDAGVVQYMLDKAKDNSRFITRRVDAEIDGKPSWPAKYAMTDLEAGARNVNKPEHPTVSLESKKQDLGEKVYMTEMMNSPEASGDLVFDRAKVDEAIKRAKPHLEDKSGFKVWDRFNPAHRYAIGGDTAKGVGRDSNASVMMDFTQFPNKVVGTYANNQIAPDIFAHELKRQGDMYGTCLIGPEVNNTGYATITTLKSIYPVEKIYRKIFKGKVASIVDKPKDEFGWETNAATKPTMLYEFKKAFEDGHIEINDISLLNEMRKYNQADLSDLKNDPEATRHFDKLMAACVCWQMRNFAEVSDSAKPVYVQDAPSVGEFEAGAIQTSLLGSQFVPYEQSQYKPEEYEQ